MIPYSRRDTLQLAAGALAASALPGCEPSRPNYQIGAIDGPVIDAHCHLFNGRDLPITTFLTRLVVKSYDDAVCDIASQALRARTIEDPTLIEAIIEKLVEWLLDDTPTALQELARLRRGVTTTATADQARVRDTTETRLTAFLDEDQATLTSARVQRDTRLRDALRDEASAASAAKGLRAASTRQAAAALLDGGGTFAALIRFLWLFFRSRESLAQELAIASQSWKRDPLMLVPLMVDYAHWLGQTTTKGSSFYDQIRVYGALCRRSPVPVHGMVPFDPLRDVFWRSGRHHRFPETPEFDPLDLAKKALTRHGFLGLKVYPPMGFSATGNLARDAAYPPAVIKALKLPKDRLGAELDRSMLRAMDFCLAQDAPMLAHANNTVASGKGYGRRAEPKFWIDALTNRPALRLSLAHGGNFCWRQSGLSDDTPDDTASWEWAIGRYVRDNPRSNLYMDISYFSEIFGVDGRQDHVARQLQNWIKACDPDARHILYGTDWIMLERVEQFSVYGTDVQAFLKDRCHLSGPQIERIMWQNALRFFGLDSGKTRDRILKFYGARRPEWTRLSPA